ncbi:FecR family protein [Pedobacter sp. BS3]|uniref:FecR family protein n=1 Tax=Pedobacter sp. BS3 TaxID=2567937 RepID=UPI0011F03651|nr:FecR family protein [Pedobacter sp. BS3]TZF81522.1 FecR family protein [Pedobacter sp. BS3]
MQQLKKEQFFEILDKFQAGNATEEEKRFLNAYYNAFDQKDSYTSKLDSTEKSRLQNELYQLIEDRIALNTKAQTKVIRVLPNWARVAAAILVVSLIGVVYYITRQDNTEKYTRLQIKPGGNKAILTLSNGKKISLTDAANGQLAEQTGVKISKAADGQLVYTANREAPVPLSERIPLEEKAGGEVAFNTIETPRGGQYQVVLPDGTKVWLNAASSLIYPTTFTGNERRVTLTGEGYFEVAKVLLNSQKSGAANALSKGKSRGEGRLPFIVITKGQQVEVLGTHFNINAYGDKQAIKTTLLEGSVRILALQTGYSRIIRPNQEAVFTGGNIKVADVDAEDAIAWKNGYFQFSGKTLDEAMQEVARWYDVEVVYKNEHLRERPLAGTISKYRNISTVLKTMELAGALHFSIENGKVILK